METLALYQVQTNGNSTLQRRRQLADELAWKQDLLRGYSIYGDLSAMALSREIIREKALRRSKIVRDELPSAQQSIDVEEAMSMLAINERVDKNGKPVAGNAETRKALLMKELTSDGNYQYLVARRVELQMEADQLDAEISLEEKRYAGARYGIEYKLALLKVLGL